MRLRPPKIPEVLREDPEAVARLLRLAAVGVEDAETEVGARAGHEQEDPVGADPPVPVADLLDRAGGQRLVQIPLVADHLAVSEPAALREGDHARPSSTRRPLSPDTYPAESTSTTSPASSAPASAPPR